MGKEKGACLRSVDLKKDRIIVDCWSNSGLRQERFKRRFGETATLARKFGHNANFG